MSKDMFAVKHETEISLSNGGINNSRYVKVFTPVFSSGLVAKLGPTNFTTLMILATMVDEKGECCPSQQTIADLMGVHKNTINKYINELLEFKFEGKPLVTRTIVNKGRGNILSYYTINIVSQDGEA
jgi:hypothetical protein